MTATADVIVVGAGLAGLTAARGLADAEVLASLAWPAGTGQSAGACSGRARGPVAGDRVKPGRVEAGPVPGMARRAHLVDLDQDRVTVAVQRD